MENILAYWNSDAKKRKILGLANAKKRKSVRVADAKKIRVQVNRKRKNGKS